MALQKVKLCDMSLPIEFPDYLFEGLIRYRFRRGGVLLKSLAERLSVFRKTPYYIPGYCVPL